MLVPLWRSSIHSLLFFNNRWLSSSTKHQNRFLLESLWIPQRTLKPERILVSQCMYILCIILFCRYISTEWVVPCIASLMTDGEESRQAKFFLGAIDWIILPTWYHEEYFSVVSVLVSKADWFFSFLLLQISRALSAVGRSSLWNRDKAQHPTITYLPVASEMITGSNQTKMLWTTYLGTYEGVRMIER